MDVKKILEAWSTVSRGPGYVIQKDDETGTKRKKAVEAKSADVKPEKYTDANGKIKIRMVPAQREDTSAAVKAFLAKGGKIKKLPPAKAQGYHGKDDPGADMHGMMDKGDTKKIGTRKKVKSMGATQVDELSKDTKKSYIKKSADDMSKQADKMARAGRDDGKMDKAVRKFVNRRKGIARAVDSVDIDNRSEDAEFFVPRPAAIKKRNAQKPPKNPNSASAAAKNRNADDRRRKGIHGRGFLESVDEAKRTVTIDKPDRLTSLRVSKDKPPFDNAKPINKNPKDKFGNPIKNRAKSLARAAARKAVGLKDTSPPFDDAKKISTTPTKDQFGNVIKNRAKSLARAAAKRAGGDMGDKQKKESVNELDQKTMNSYHDKAQKSKDRATNSAVATIMRKGDHSKDLQTRAKRIKGMELAKSRTIKKIRGDK
jgi:hypothetical protein